MNSKLRSLQKAVPEVFEGGELSLHLLQKILEQGAKYSTRKRQDYSPFAAHFCKDTKIGGGKHIIMQHSLKSGDPLHSFITSTGLEKIKNILKIKKIYGSPMPHLKIGPPQAVCFSECVWGSILQHCEVYGRYGIGFRKDFLFDKGGGPALYMRGDRLKALQQSMPKELLPFVTPFDPGGLLKINTPIDYTHEREWRVPENLEFEYKDVSFVVVSTKDDYDSLIREIGKNQIPGEKFIVMSEYENVKKLWPW